MPPLPAWWDWAPGNALWEEAEGAWSGRLLADEKEPCCEGTRGWPCNDYHRHFVRLKHMFSQLASLRTLTQLFSLTLKCNV